MKDAFLALIARDARSLVKALSQLGFIEEGASLAPIERALSLLIERYHGLTLGEVSKLEIAKMIQEFASLLYQQPIRIPATFALTGRALGILVGVSTGLAPGLNFVEVALPYARKFLGFDAEGAQQTLQQILNHALDAGRALLTLPRSLEEAIDRFGTGQIQVNLVNTQPNGWIRLRFPWSGKDNGVSPAAYGFLWLFMFVASLAGGIFLLTATHEFMAGWFCFGLAGLAMLRLLLIR